MKQIKRRTLLIGLGALGLAPALARAQSWLDLTEFGLVADLGGDQSQALQAALDAAAQRGLAVMLPPGIIEVRDIVLPSAVAIEGMAGRSVLAAWQDGIIAAANAPDGLTITGVSFVGGVDAPDGRGLLEISDSAGATLHNCRFSGGGAMGLATSKSRITVSNCSFAGQTDAAIHAVDSHDLRITGNRIADCGNAGIRIWRSTSGSDSSIITENHISGIKANSGGNGQNGNGINVFKADGVIVANNHIADCAFTAIRLNATNNSHVSGNTCLNSGEVAIFSEFGFSGSVIANNIVDGAAGGISMTNYNDGGHLAVCTGNIVRNIAPKSLVNPDTTPFGIAAEADAAVIGNAISKVPGPAIVAGYGPYLRDVLIANNVISDSLVGVAVSVAEGAGKAQISNNVISGATHAIVGMAWTEMVDPNLIVNAVDYPRLSVSGNTVNGG